MAKRTQGQIGTIPFILGWILAHIAAWYILFAVSEELDYFYRLPDWVQGVMFGIIMALIIPITQKWLIRRKFSVQLVGWLRVSAIAWVIGMMSIVIVPEFLEEFVSGDPIWMYVIVAFTIPAIAQWLILRRVIRGSWVWIIAGAASAFAFGAIIDAAISNADFYPYWTVAAGIQGAVTGLSLLWLFYQSHITHEKYK